MQAACPLYVGEPWGTAVLAAIQPSYYPPKPDLLNCAPNGIGMRFPTMYKNGHRGAALLLMAPLTAAFGVIGIGMSVVAVAICRLPDLDHDYGWLAHRGPTHTIWFATVVAGLVVTGGYAALSMIPVALPALPLALLLGATVFLGLLSHLFADALTVGGGSHAIRPFHPLSPHPFRLGLVRADSRLANALLLAGGVLCQGLAFAVSVGGTPGVVV